MSAPRFIHLSEFEKCAAVFSFTLGFCGWDNTYHCCTNSSPMFREPLISPGAWRVTRDCCVTGDCDKCKSWRSTPYGPAVRVVQADNVPKEYAERVARVWSGYHPRVEQLS
jgi:hypothetical protein